MTLKITIPMPIQWEYTLPDGTTGSGSTTGYIDPSDPTPPYQQIKNALSSVGGTIPEAAGDDATFQAAINKREGTRGRIASVPAWATMADAEAFEWLEANLKAPVATGKTALANATTLAQIKPIVSGMLDLMAEQNGILEKLVIMTLALRDRAWPDLSAQVLTQAQAKA